LSRRYSELLMSEAPTTLVYDLETDGLLDTVSRIWTLVIGDPKSGEIVAYADQPGYPPLADGLARLKDCPRLVAHNCISYDYRVLEKLYPGTVRFEQQWDTFVVSRLLDPERKGHSLGDWGTRLNMPKGDHSDFSRFSEEMVKYSRQDVAITIEVFKRLWKGSKGWERAVALEFQVALAIALQETNGFRLDLDAARDLEAELRQEQVNLERRLQDIYPGMWVAKRKTSTLVPGIDNLKDAIFTPKTGKPTGKSEYVAGASFTKIEWLEFNPGSRQQIEARLRLRYGWAPKKFTAGGSAEINDAILNEIAVLYPEAKDLAAYFRVKKQLGQIADGDNAWLKLYRGEHPNARVHGRVNSNGAVTGRMTHFQPNMAQVDKKDLRMRAVWTATPGLSLVGCDAEGLELRMLGHYLQPYDGGEYITAVIDGKKEDGTDVHTRTQKLVGLHKRDNAKTLIYAYLYGAGDKKLGLIIIEDADEAKKPRPKGSLSALGKKAREKLQVGITGLGKLVGKVKNAHATRGHLLSLDGRKLTTRSAHSALNTLLQGAGAVVMKQALAIFHFEMMRGFDQVSPNFIGLGLFNYCANVHDEVQIECAPDFAEKLGTGFAACITEAGVRLGVRCPLSGSFQVGTNWKETH
jgi:DNA polymerase-1